MGEPVPPFTPDDADTILAEATAEQEAKILSQVPIEALIPSIFDSHKETIATESEMREKTGRIDTLIKIRNAGHVIGGAMLVGMAITADPGNTYDLTTSILAVGGTLTLMAGHISGEVEKGMRTELEKMRITSDEAKMKLNNLVRIIAPDYQKIKEKIDLDEDGEIDTSRLVDKPPPDRLSIEDLLDIANEDSKDETSSQ